jgi:hypothetical protein
MPNVTLALTPAHQGVLLAALDLLEENLCEHAKFGANVAEQLVEVRALASVIVYLKGGPHG